jgi:hypothetical protein
MQPQNYEVPIGPEQLPAQPAPSGERVPVLPTPESGIETGVDRREQVAESRAIASDASSAAAPIMPIATPVIQPVDDSTTAVSVGPMVAADEDVIEKEWVDKAKQIIIETKDDPYQRSTRVSELQRDYLSKRYGKNLGAQPN